MSTDLNIGSLSLSAHKIYSPKGIGIAFLRRDLQNQIEPLIYGGGQQRNLRSGTLPTPLCVGLGAAISLLQEKNRTAESERVRAMRDQLEEKLCALGTFVKVNAAGVRVTLVISIFDLMGTQLKIFLQPFNLI